MAWFESFVGKNVRITMDLKVDELDGQVSRVVSGKMIEYDGNGITLETPGGKTALVFLGHVELIEEI